MTDGVNSQLILNNINKMRGVRAEATCISTNKSSQNPNLQNNLKPKNHKTNLKT